MKGARQPKIGLWLDTSCTETSLALLQDGELLTLRSSSENALDFIFTALDSSLAEHSLSFKDIIEIHYCGGPGSTLGLRIAAMALKTWKALRPGIDLFTSNSLLVQTALLAEEPNHPTNFTLIAQHRKGLWYSLEYNGKQYSKDKPNTLSDEDIPKLRGIIFHMQQRKFASNLPDNFQPMPVHHKHISKILQNNEIFHPVDKPEFFDTGTPTFSKWTPERHSKST